VYAQQQAASVTSRNGARQRLERTQIWRERGFVLFDSHCCRAAREVEMHGRMTFVSDFRAANLAVGSASAVTASAATGASIQKW